MSKRKKTGAEEEVIPSTSGDVRYVSDPTREARRPQTWSRLPSPRPLPGQPERPDTRRRQSLGRREPKEGDGERA